MRSRRPATGLPSDAPAPGWRDPAPALARDRSSSAAAERRRLTRLARLSAVDARFSGERRDAGHDGRRHRIEIEIERHRQILRHRHRFEQHDAIADDAETLDEGEPFVAVGDGACRRPSVATSPLSGSDAPVIRLTKTSAAGRSNPSSMATTPSGTRKCRTLSGRSPPYCFSTSVRTRASGTTAAADSLRRRPGRFP